MDRRQGIPTTCWRPLADVRNPISGPESLGEFNGRLVPLVMYCHAHNVLAPLTYANKPRRIVEIGGGYGEIARMGQKSNSTLEFYVIIDYSGMPLFRRNRLKGKVAYFDGSRISDPARPATIPRDFRRCSDIVINAGSMQEMIDEWISLCRTTTVDFSIASIMQLSRFRSW